jgi:hypothetical protein
MIDFPDPPQAIDTIFQAGGKTWKWNGVAWVGAIGNISVTWDNLAGKPSSFTPSTHTHKELNSAGASSRLEIKDDGDLVITDGAITTTLSNTSTIARVFSLPDKSGVLAVTDDIVKADWTAESGPSQILNKPALNFATVEQGAKADTASQPGHGHSISDVNGLQAALDSAIPLPPSDIYIEPTYSSGVLTAMTTWNSSAKAVLIETKNFNYTDGKLTQIIVKDGNAVTTLTKILNYSGDTLASITEDYA